MTARQRFGICVLAVTVLGSVPVLVGRGNVTTAKTTVREARGASQLDLPRELDRLQKIIAQLQVNVIAGEVQSTEVAAFLVEFLDFVWPELARRPSAEGWDTYEFENDRLGMITLSIGPPQHVRRIVLVIEGQEASFLEQPISLVDTQFRIYAGLTNTSFEYYAASLEARVHPSDEIAGKLDGGKVIRVGGTYEIRDGKQLWSEVVIEGGFLEDGRPYTTSRIRPQREVGTLRFSDVSELPHLHSLLTAIANS